MFEQRFLDKYGVAVDDDGHVGIKDRDPADVPCPGTFVTLLPRISLLRVGGADALEFLHGQLTCDVKQLQDGTGSTAAWCSPKGRVITTFVIYLLGDEFFLLVPGVLRERVIKRLRMFVLRADVAITDFSAERSVMGARGKAQPIPESGHGFSINRLNERLHLFLPDADGSRCLIVDDTAALQAVWEELAHTMPPADSRCWDRLDLEAGIPWLNEATTEQFLPQELNLEETGGLSFTKGCYPGQEVVARVHYRGQVKRRLCRGNVPAQTPPLPGAKLRDADGRGAGMIVAAVPEPGGGWKVMAVIDNAGIEAGAIRLDDGTSFSIGQAQSNAD